MKNFYIKSSFLICNILLIVLASCTDMPENVKKLGVKPVIYPDYIDVTIPIGIAPLNFTLVDVDFDCIDVVCNGSKGGQLHSNGKKVDFDINDWHKILEENKGGELTFTVSCKHDGDWTQYDDFTMTVSTYPLDEWGLTYRRIAPGYEVYSHMGLYQRDLSTFDEYEIIDNNRTPGDCVNCHTSNRTNPDEFVFHVRGVNGATALWQNGEMIMLDTKTDSTLGLCVYPYWHPNGRYVAFSTNTTRQGFHVSKDERIEVFDHESDLQILDTKTRELIISPLVKRVDQNETFPAFSADGNTLYFCSAVKREYPKDMRIVRYNLCKIGFDYEKREFTDSVEVVVDAVSDSASISIPKPSYDGRFLMYTLADYGTFPIWHKEADLWLLDLKTGERRALVEVNSNDTESYHNWSRNSRWFVFSSRRDDGLYTRLYISSIDESGKATKPFLLPQKDPKRYYERLLYSYNVPDFTQRKVEINSRRVANEILSEKRTKLSVRQKH